MEEWSRDLDERGEALNEGQEHVRELLRKAKGSAAHPAERERTDEQPTGGAQAAGPAPPSLPSHQPAPSGPAAAAAPRQPAVDEAIEPDEQAAAEVVRTAAGALGKVRAAKGVGGFGAAPADGTAGQAGKWI